MARTRISQEMMQYWGKENDAGAGYGIGEERGDPEAAALLEGWTIEDRGPDGMVLARTPAGELVLVCDSNGPWCVTLRDDAQDV